MKPSAQNNIFAKGFLGILFGVLATGIIGFFLNVDPIQAAWCITKGEKTDCIPNFNYTSGTPVNQTYQIEGKTADPNKKWTITNQRSGYCNNNVCVNDLGLPKFEMVSRGDDNDTDDKIQIRLRVQGNTGSYWYVRKNSGYSNDDGYPNTGDPQEDRGLSRIQYDGIQGLRGGNYAQNLCPGDNGSSWDDKFDVTQAGGYFTAEAPGPRTCYDSKLVTVTHKAPQQVTDPKHQDTWRVYVYSPQDGMMHYTDHTDAGTYPNGWNAYWNNCWKGWPLNCEGRWEQPRYPECGCGKNDPTEKLCISYGVAGLQSNNNCYDFFKKHIGFGTKTENSKTVTEMRYREVTTVPRFSLATLNNKTAYAPHREGAVWPDNTYLLYYDTKNLNRTDGAKNKVKAVQNEQPVFSDLNKCIFDRKFLEVTHHGSYTDYVVQAEGLLGNRFIGWLLLSRDEQNAIKQKILTHDKRFYDRSIKDAQNEEQVGLVLMSFKATDAFKNDVINSKLLKEKEFNVIFKGVSQTVQAATEVPKEKDEGIACRAQLPSEFGMTSTYTYFTGPASIPPVEIRSFRATAVGPDSDFVGETTQELTSIGSGANVLPDPTNRFSSARADLSAGAGEVLDLQAYQDTVNLRLEWQTPFAGRVRIFQKDERHATATDLSQLACLGRWGDIIDSNDPCPARGEVTSVRELTVEGLQSNKNYTFYIVVENKRGDSTALQPTQWATAARLDVTVRPAPIVVTSATAKYVKGKENCKSNALPGQTNTPTECAEITWKVDGRPTEIVLKAPKGWNRTVWTDHTFASHSYTSNGDFDRYFPIHTSEINRYRSNFILIAKRGDITSAEFPFELRGVPRDPMTIAAEGWKDGNNVRDKSLFEAILNTDCDEWWPGLDLICRGTTFSSIFNIARESISSSLAGALAVVTGGAGALLKPIVDFVLRVVEPIAFGLVGMIGNLVQANNENLIDWKKDINWQPFLGSFGLSFAVNSFTGVLQAIFGKCAAAPLVGAIHQVIDLVGTLLRIAGINLGCPDGEENSCEMGADMGKTMGIIAGETVYYAVTGDNSWKPEVCPGEKPPEEEEDPCTPKPGEPFDYARSQECFGEKYLPQRYGCNEENKCVPAEAGTFADPLCSNTCDVSKIVEKKVTEIVKEDTKSIFDCSGTVDGTEVGQGYGGERYANEYQYRTRSKKAVADALMSAYYVATCGKFCLRKDAALSCSEDLYNNNKNNFDSIFNTADSYIDDKNRRNLSTKVHDNLFRDTFDGLMKEAASCGIKDVTRFIPVPCAFAQ